ncbi:Uncharacterised protein [Streptococcus pneumoniae]|nr:Uncharacterised protein [Streptococcus pneumoniae]
MVIAVLVQTTTAASIAKVKIKPFISRVKRLASFALFLTSFFDFP